MKNLKYVVPNSLSLINLLLGCAAITVVFRGQNEYNAAWLIILAAVFDLFDGMTARALNARSEFGKQLDSLADIVSFGVAPAIIFFNWYILVLIDLSAQSTFDLASASFKQKIILLSSLFFAVAAAIRLARFNISTTDGKTFKGLSTTAAALITASVWLIVGWNENDVIHDIMLNVYVVFFVLVLLVVLMVSNLKMLSLKFRGTSLRDNLLQYILILVSAILITVFRIEGIFLSMMFYLLLSLMVSAFKKADL